MLRGVGRGSPPGILGHQRFGREVLDYDGPRRRPLCFGWIRRRGRADRVRYGSGEGRAIQRAGIMRARRRSTSTRGSRSIHRSILRRRRRRGPNCAIRRSIRCRRDPTGGVGLSRRCRCASRSSSRGRYCRGHLRRSVLRSPSGILRSPSGILRSPSGILRSPSRRRRCGTGRRRRG